MAKLNQIIAIEKGAKSRATAGLTEAYHAAQRVEPLKGISRTYQPREDEGERLPGESKRVQITAAQIVADAQAALTELFNVTATKDWANTEAKASVVVDGRTILADVPITFLIFLEKQLAELRTFVSKLPTLDPGFIWIWDGAADCYAAVPIETTRTRKVPRNHVKAEATKEHPAQVEVYYEDVIVGTWTTINFSGALPAEEVRKLQGRIDALAAAVKFAREEANSTEVERHDVADAVLGFVFGDLAGARTPGHVA
jgi:hypothetical protein